MYRWVDTNRQIIMITIHLFRSILCLINQHHNVFIPVSANIVSISLELSASHITLLPPSLSTLSHTLEGHVTLHNPHHVPVNFTWDMGDYENYLATTHMEGTMTSPIVQHCSIDNRFIKILQFFI